MWNASLQVEMLNSWTDESGRYHLQGWEQSQADVLDAWRQCGEIKTGWYAAIIRTRFKRLLHVRVGTNLTSFVWIQTKADAEQLCISSSAELYATKCSCCGLCEWECGAHRYAFRCVYILYACTYGNWSPLVSLHTHEYACLTIWCSERQWSVGNRIRVVGDG